MPLRTVTATRYVTPLREGGSLPAIIEADDSGLYVLKFRGAGQGPPALVAELVAGEIARAVGLAMPEIVFVELDPDLARTEPDPEIQALIRASAGVNLALDYLPGSLTFDLVVDAIDATNASSIVWLDGFVSNVDRTPRNTNMLVWHKRVWLIDHGAAFYFHHAGGDFTNRARDPFINIAQHVLLPRAERLGEVDDDLSARLSGSLIASILEQAPDAWLGDKLSPEGASARRRMYVDYLTQRLMAPRPFVEEARRVRSGRV